ncbi:hypothetical protein FQA39_LY02712 [Lamprigera yunnana]|nr:hypothetical protein FQA39_LY02712 [Lamprigera yunnana]
MTTKSRRSSSSINRNLSKPFTAGKKLGPVGRSPSLTSTFEAILKMNWERFCTTSFPQIKVVPNESSPGNFSKGKHSEISSNSIKEPDGLVKLPEILTIFDNSDRQIGLNTIIFKHFKVTREMLIALRNTCPKFDTIKILKLEYCNLSNTDLRTIKTIIRANANIKSLSLNGNPNAFQNFYIQIKNSSLSQIFLKSCKINDRGAELISKQLLTTNHPLQFLDLSSNFITDVGVSAISEVLRINRTLYSLNLADNWITDAGCLQIVTALRRFLLTDSECSIRRRRVMSNLRDRSQELEVQSTMLQNMTPLFAKKLSAESVKGAKDDTKSSRVQSLPSSATTKTDKDKEKRLLQPITRKSLVPLQQTTVKSDIHPFVEDTFYENNEIWCTGNLTLLNLNLSYNKITKNCEQKIREMLQYQQKIGRGLKGLTNIFLEGNSFYECTAINYLQCLQQDLDISSYLAFSKGSIRMKKPLIRAVSANI